MTRKTMTRKKIASVHVGEGLKASGRRFVEAWKEAEKGRDFEETHISFESIGALARAMTEKRLALLRHLRRHPANSIAELARQLRRDYRRVHADVVLLSSLRLLDRTDGIKVRYSEIRASVRI